MSLHAPAIAGRPRTAAREGVAARPLRRTIVFGVFAVYGVGRWGRLERQPPTPRLLGLALAATALAGLGPLAERLGEATGRPRAVRALALGLGGLLGLATLPIAGLRWTWVRHVRVAVSARAIGHGLGDLVDVLVPYLGHAYPVRLTMALGAALLLLAAAVALAAGGRSIGDGRRAVAALALVALVVVPETLVPGSDPGLSGLVLFALVAALVWGERVVPGAGGAIAAVAGLAAVVGLLVAPHVEDGRAWLDYHAWLGTTPSAPVARFAWDQTYGPLRWPQTGHTVLVVRARSGDYWKAEDLTAFDGRGWRAQPTASAATLPTPSAWARRRYTEDASITVEGMDTDEVIAGSGIAERVSVPGGARPGDVAGTWRAARPLTPGTSYEVRTYSPDPGGARLTRAGDRYPWRALAPDLTLTLPSRVGAVGRPVTFPAFGRSGARARLTAGLADSPYVGALSLAGALADRARTPYGFVEAVQGYLDGGAFRYDQSPPVARYPLQSFLFDTRVGYCQQFSGAMALLLRMGGVPARVASGFTQGLLDDATHTWTVSDLDAHAWVEVWFPRYGWVKFDPTPTAAPARGGGGAGAAASDLGVRPLAPRTAAASAAARARPAGTGTPRRPGSTGRDRRAADGGPRHRGGRGGTPWGFVAAGTGGVVLLALAGALGLRAGVLGAGGLGAGRRADPLAELERALARMGRPLAPGTTLAGLEARLGSASAAAYVRALRAERYGPARVDAGTGAAAEAGAAAGPSAAGRRALRAELAAGRGPVGRVRAAWALPPRLGGRRRRTP